MMAKAPRRRRRPGLALAFALALIPASSSVAAAESASAAVASSSSPLSLTLQKLASDFRDSPYPRALIVAGVKGAAADWIAQRTEASERRGASAKATTTASEDRGAPKAAVPSEPHHSYSYRRTLAFIIYGSLYQGAALEFIFNDLFSRLFGNDGLVSNLKKVSCNQLLVAPFLTLPVAYVVRGAVVLGSGPAASLRKYKANATLRPGDGGGIGGGNVLLAFWMVWTPVNCVLFGFVPARWRISVNQVISLLWTVVLSRMSQMAKEEGKGRDGR